MHLLTPMNISVLHCGKSWNNNILCETVNKQIEQIKIPFSKNWGLWNANKNKIQSEDKNNNSLVSDISYLVSVSFPNKYGA